MHTEQSLTPLRAARDAGQSQQGRAILYIQYTNPGAYPPLGAGARLLAARGWRVTFLGARTAATAALTLATGSNMRVLLLPLGAPGWRQKLSYARFCFAAMRLALKLRPAWIYASEPLSAIPTLLASRVTGTPTVYHEHDSPARPACGMFERIVARSRRSLAHASRICVLPNAHRAGAFAETLRLRREKVLCVWNCPDAREAEIRCVARDSVDLWLHYHGNISPDLVPLEIIEALRDLPDNVKLRIVGYETPGNVGYGQQILSHCDDIGVARSRIELIGPRSRDEVLAIARTASVGVALIRTVQGNLNMQHLAGASNKPFDYLACGLPLLVSDTPQWHEMYVRPGYGLACDPANAHAIRAAVEWYMHNPRRRIEMGERGRERILAEWNYANVFAPVLRELESGAHATAPV